MGYKNEYVKPQFKCLNFEFDDVLTTSPPCIGKDVCPELSESNNDAVGDFSVTPPEEKLELDNAN